MLVLKNVKQWNKEKVAKGSTVTGCDFSTYSVLIYPAHFLQLTVDGLGNPPEESQERVLAVLVNQSPPEPWLGQLGTAERFIDYNKIGEECTRVCEPVGLDGSSTEEDCLENNVDCGV